MGVPRLWSVQVELTEGCQLRCPMCGIASLKLRRDEYHFLTVPLARQEAAKIAAYCPTARIDCRNHGEPLMNPNALEILSILRETLPDTQIQVTTNGVVFLRGWTRWRDELAERVNVLLIDRYDPYGQRLQEIIEADPGPWRLKDFYKDDFNPYHNHGPKGATIVFMDDLIRRNGERRQRQVVNQGGNSPARPPLVHPISRTCTRPFREMVIRWDGKVGLCCDDWGLEYQVGDLSRPEQTMASIWEGEAMVAARRFLWAKRRCFAPCVFCDTHCGQRVGLLPKQPQPTAEDFEVAARTNVSSPRYNGREPRFDVAVAVGKPSFF